MPKGQNVDETKWSKAKKIAAAQGRAKDFAYIMGIYKKMMGGDEKKHLKRAPEDRYFDPMELSRGARVEREHTNSDYEARTIAKHHLAETGRKDNSGRYRSDYYRELANMERRLRKASIEHEFDTEINILKSMVD